MFFGLQDIVMFETGYVNVSSSPRLLYLDIASKKGRTGSLVFLL